MKIEKLFPNQGNTRNIDEQKFIKLKASIQRDPKFMVLRPIVYQKNGMIIAGNMRYRAIVDLQMTEIPDNWAIEATDLTKEEIRRFQIIDNISYGYWDWDVITSHYKEDELIEWGMDLPVDPIPEADEPLPPMSHSFKIRCDDLDQLIELCEMLNIDTESRSMSYGNFKLIFQHRKD